MTTKPKARRFRIKRGAQEQSAPPHAQPAQDGGHASLRDRIGAPQPAPQQHYVEPQAAPSHAAQAHAQPTPQQSVQVQRAHPNPQPNEQMTHAQRVQALQAQAQRFEAENPQARNVQLHQIQVQPAAPAQPQARGGEVALAAQVEAEADISAIRREGLTGRQLRLARRMAQKHGLPATSDFDAVRLLRKQGIDPFERNSMLELVVPNKTGNANTAGAVQPQSGKVALPQTVAPQRVPATSPDLSPAERRSKEVAQIQRDIGRRRRKKSLLLLIRLAFFVFLPTLFAGYYYYVMATNMYATNSEFLIITNEGGGGGGAGGLGGLLPTQFATSSDAIAVQGYLQSKDAMLRLDEDLDFMSHFKQERIDPIQRLDQDATIEKAYRTFKQRVKIGYDPTEGVIRMEVVAADPQTTTNFSNKLITYAEERVNQLSQQKREDQMREAREGLDRAQQERRAAQEALVELQLEGNILDPESVIAARQTRINELESQITQKEIELESLLINQRPNQSRVAAVRRDIEIYKVQLERLNAQMTDDSKGENSLARLAARLQLARADLASRDAMLQSSIEQLEQARIEANKQVRYLVISVKPVAPEEASYPRAFENTILAFLVFAGVYLMMSLTASILREQVTT